MPRSLLVHSKDFLKGNCVECIHLKQLAIVWICVQVTNDDCVVAATLCLRRTCRKATFILYAFFIVKVVISLQRSEPSNVTFVVVVNAPRFIETDPLNRPTAVSGTAVDKRFPFEHDTLTARPIA